MAQHLVIMAGGVGSRFWPMSKEDHPKQFLDILGKGRSMLQLTYDRFAGIVQPENTWVVTSSQYGDLVHEQLPEVPLSNILQEPCRRNTAPCIAYVSWRIKHRDPNAVIVVSPSDHDIQDVPTFRNVISQSLQFASETDAIITLGMKPTRPETGYGYIKADLSLESSRRENFYRVDEFREKPDLETAKGYIAQQNFYWNSGIFVWDIATIINAFRVYKPEIAEIFDDLRPYYDTPEEQAHIDAAFPKCPAISIDYAIMEQAEETFVYPSEFGWSDLGTWGSLLKQLTPDDNGNATVGEDIHLYDTRNCIVHAPGLKKVVVQGLDGYIVVEKDGMLLICKLTDEQRIQTFH